MFFAFKQPCFDSPMWSLVIMRDMRYVGDVPRACPRLGGRGRAPHGALGGFTATVSSPFDA